MPTTYVLLLLVMAVIAAFAFLLIYMSKHSKQ